MDMTCHSRNDTVQVYLAGLIDNDTAGEFREKLHEILTRQEKNIIFDFSAVTMFSSSAIGKLILFYKHASEQGKNLRVKGVNEYIYNLFQFSSLDLLFPIEQ